MVAVWVVVEVCCVDMVDNMALLNVAYSNEKNFEFKVLRNNEELIILGTIND